MICMSCKDDLPESEYDIRKSTKKLKKFCRTCCKAVSKVSKKNGRKHRSNPGDTYSGRNQWLLELGFPTYAAYLASPLWKEIKKKVIKAKGNLCVICNSLATQLHHSRYFLNDLKGNKIRFIHPICRACHIRVEFQDDGKTKLTMKDASQKFRKLKREADQARREAGLCSPPNRSAKCPRCGCPKKAPTLCRGCAKVPLDSLATA